MIRLLTFTNLYPSVRSPRHGIFVEARLRRLVETGRVSARVVVPMPRDVFGAAAPALAPTERFGIPVSYVDFPVARGLTTFFNPLSMALAARPALAALQRRGGDFDVIDAHFFYPDGVAAALLGRWFGKPVVITARGSDVNVAARERIAGACIRWAARRADALISVSVALRDAMAARGLPPSRITVLRNGVDLEAFRPLDRDAVRRELGFAGAVLLSVGNLVVEKGHDLVLAALRKLPDVRLIVIGSGPERERLQRLAGSLGVGTRVQWLAPVPQLELARYYVGADLTVLASTREGMPNVLLESLACGTPVVATDVGGSPEIVTEPVAGRLLSGRSPEALALACAELLAAPPEPAAVRAFAERFGWSEPVAGQLALLQSVVERRPVPPRAVVGGAH